MQRCACREQECHRGRFYHHTDFVLTDCLQTQCFVIARAAYQVCKGGMWLQRLWPGCGSTRRNFSCARCRMESQFETDMRKSMADVIGSVKMLSERLDTIEERLDQHDKIHVNVYAARPHRSKHTSFAVGTEGVLWPAE